MSPIVDPSYASKRREMMERESADADRAARMEYIKPLAMLGIGWAVVLAVLATKGDDEVSAAGLIGIYLVVFAVSLVCGIGGLWIASNLWLGGAGTLGLCILRLAGIYAITDAVGQFTSGLMLLAWFINGVVYVALLMWLFELEWTESIMLALITYVLKVAAAVVLMLALTT